MTTTLARPEPITDDTTEPLALPPAERAATGMERPPLPPTTQRRPINTTNPPSPLSPQTPAGSAPSLTSDLMDDILDPTLSPVQICKIHDLTLDQLAATKARLLETAVPPPGGPARRAGSQSHPRSPRWPGSPSRVFDLLARACSGDEACP